MKPINRSEYINLTQSELDMATLRQYQELSASREGKSARGTNTYINPMRPVKK